ncbi:hypothetical protein PENSPDRAFT_65841 [Peniophora sp. CONT]|nr:hypothetical protein PENSPDRAFT_65841 [Peniophora sp. CONT]
MPHHPLNMLWQPKYLVQTTLDQWVSGVRPKPCYFERLPPELFQEIIGYLPYQTNCARRHCDPLRDLPEADDLSREIESYDPGNCVSANTLSECPAERLISSGCAAYCPAQFYPWNWLDVMRVSKAWRAACLAYEPFWARIPLHSQFWVERSALILSGTLPVQIYYDVAQHQACTFIEIIQRFSRRVSELSINSGTKPSPDIYLLRDSLGGLDMPQLEAFSYLAPPLILRLSYIFQNSALPNLRYLDLELFSLLSCRNLLAPSLVHLRLVHCPDTWRLMSEMKAVLESMPCIRELLLIGDTCFPDDLVDNDSIENRTPLTIPSLRLLHINVEPHIATRFLEIVHLPPTASLEVTLNHEDHFQEDYLTPLAQFVSARYQSITRDSPLSHNAVCFQLEHDDDAIYDATILVYQMAVSEVSAALPHIAIRHSWIADRKEAPATRYFNNLILGYVQVLPCDQIEALYIESWICNARVVDFGLDAAFFEEFLSRFTRLRYLCLRWDADEISSWIDSKLRREPMIPFLSNLEVVDFRQCYIQVPHLWRDILGRKDKSHRLPPEWALLAETLQSRVVLREDGEYRPCAVRFSNCYGAYDYTDNDWMPYVFARIPGAIITATGRGSNLAFEEAITGRSRRRFD